MLRRPLFPPYPYSPQKSTKSMGPVGSIRSIGPVCTIRSTGPVCSVCPIRSVGPVCTIRSIGPVMQPIQPIQLLLPLPLLHGSQLPLIHGIQHSIPLTLRTCIHERLCIRPTIMCQSLAFILLIIPIIARAVVGFGCNAFDDFFPPVTAVDPKDSVPCAHLCAGGYL
jgi:hypothetical protein